MNLKGKKFVASYSGGKDSIFAIYKAILAGLEPVGLINMRNEKRPQFNGISENLLKKVSEAIEIPVTIIHTPGDLYKENFEKILTESKENEAEVCVFGDIDMQAHFEWGSERCVQVGLTPYFPLWKEERKKIVYDFIDAGFSTVITIVDTTRMSEEFLGQVLNREAADAIEKSGADICGENGEYHTFTFDGPIFKNKVHYSFKDKIINDKYTLFTIE